MTTLRDPAEHIERERRVAAILAEAERDLSAWLLARKIGESAETIDRLGLIAYEKLGEALDLDPDGLAVMAIAYALVQTGRPKTAATRDLVKLREFMGADR